LTISCTDGTTTQTAVCPSTSPYEVEFDINSGSTYEVSGTIGNITYTETIVVTDFTVNLTTLEDITVDFYSAAADTVSYTGVDGQTHTITTDNSGYARATITINTLNGSTFTFTSNVAKQPTNLSNSYTKQITLTKNTSSVYFMPDGTVMYWWGYKNDLLETCSTANGWSGTSGMYDPTYNINNIVANGGSLVFRGVGKKTTTAFKGTHHLISKGQSNAGLACTSGANKTIVYEGPTTIIVPSSNSQMVYQSANYTGDCNVYAHGRKAESNQFTMWAWWVVTT